MPAQHILDVDLPEQAPSGAPGGDYQHINTSPAMFGAYGGQAEEKLGQGLTQAGVTGLEAATQTQERINSLYNVEVNSWFADHLSDMHAKFMNLEGKAAADALPDYKKQVEDLRREAMSKVTSPVAQAQLAPSLRTLQDQYWRYWSGHAGTQLNTYDKTVTGNAIATQAATAVNALNAGDELGFTRAMNNQDNEVRNFYAAQGYESDAIEGEVQKRRGQTLSAIIDMTADSGNVGKANQLFEQFKPKMDAASIAKVTAKLKTVNNQTKAIGIVDGETRPSTPYDIAQKTVGLSTVQDRGTLAEFFKTVGGQNIDPATTPWCAAWANSVLRAAGYAGTNSAAARSFLNYGTPTNEPQQGDIVVLSRGGDPSKGHVGFYAGPGDTPGSIKILGGNQGGAVSVAEFPAAHVLGYRRLSQSDVAGKMPPLGPGPASFVNDNKAAVMERILNRPDLRENPLLRDAVVQEVNRRYTIQQANYADQEHQWQINKHQQEEAYKQATDELLAGVTANDPNWNSARVMSDPRFAYNREHALQLVQRPVMAEPDARQSALTRRSLEERIGLPLSDPNRIQNRQQIYGYFPQLTTKDYEALNKQVDDLHAEDGQRLAERKKEFLDGIKANFADPMNMGALSGEQGQQFDLFRGDLEKKISQYRNDKKDPFDLMDPSKPDYLGSVENVNSYKRSLQEQLAARARDVWKQGAAPIAPPLGVNAPAPAAPTAPPRAATPAVPPRQEGETLAQWLARTGRNPFGPRAENEPAVPMSR